MRGTLGLTVDLKLPQSKWVDADGTIDFRCDDCATGAGKVGMPRRGGSKASKRAAAFMGGGLTVPAIKLGNLSVELLAQGGGQGFKPKIGLLFEPLPVGTELPVVDRACRLVTLRVKAQALNVPLPHDKLAMQQRVRIKGQGDLVGVEEVRIGSLGGGNRQVMDA